MLFTLPEVELMERKLAHLIWKEVKEHGELDDLRQSLAKECWKEISAELRSLAMEEAAEKRALGVLSDVEHGLFLESLKYINFWRVLQYIDQKGG